MSYLPNMSTINIGLNCAIHYTNSESSSLSSELLSLSWGTPSLVMMMLDQPPMESMELRRMSLIELQGVVRRRRGTQGDLPCPHPGPQNCSSVRGEERTTTTPSCPAAACPVRTPVCPPPPLDRSQTLQSLWGISELNNKFLNYLCLELESFQHLCSPSLPYIAYMSPYLVTSKYFLYS